MEELVELIINPNTREFGIRLLSDTLGLEEIHTERSYTTAFNGIGRFNFLFSKENYKKVQNFIIALRPYFEKYNIVFNIEHTISAKSPDILKLFLIFYGLKQ